MAIPNYSSRVAAIPWFNELLLFTDSNTTKIRIEKIQDVGNGYNQHRMLLMD